MTEDAMPRTLLTVALVPRLADPPEPAPIDVELAQARQRVDDLEWRVDWLEAELVAEREQRRELEVELRSVRRLVDAGIVDADRRRYTGHLPASGDRRREDGRRDLPPPPSTTS